MDRGAWWVTVHGVAKSQTRLKQLHRHTRIFSHYVLCTNLDLTWYSNSLFLIPTVKFFPFFFILFPSFPPLFFQSLLRGEIGSLGLRLRLSLWWMETKNGNLFESSIKGIYRQHFWPQTWKKWLGPVDTKSQHYKANTRNLFFIGRQKYSCVHSPVVLFFLMHLGCTID